MQFAARKEILFKIFENSWVPFYVIKIKSSMNMEGQNLQKILKIQCEKKQVTKYVLFNFGFCFKNVSRCTENK